MEIKSIFLILAVLITASVLFAGCATQSPATVTPTPVPTVTTELTTAPVTTETTAVPMTTVTTAVPMTTVTTAVPMTTVTTAAPMTTVTTVAPTTQAGMMNIVDTLAADGRFTTLVTALKASHLDGNLSGPGSFTIFAPTDDAFKKLPAGTIDSLLKDPQGFYLKKMLSYHIVNRELMTADIMRLGTINTLQGESLLISSGNGVIFVNGGTKIITPDIVCSNGVIQVIDTVLTP